MPAEYSTSHGVRSWQKMGSPSFYNPPSGPPSPGMMSSVSTMNKVYSTGSNPSMMMGSSSMMMGNPRMMMGSSSMMMGSSSMMRTSGNVFDARQPSAVSMGQHPLPGPANLGVFGSTSYAVDDIVGYDNEYSLTFSPLV